MSNLSFRDFNHPNPIDLNHT